MPEDYKQRVLDEKNILDRKLSKLRAFVDSDDIDNLPNRDRDLLIRQLESMSGYSDILKQRIERF